MPPAVALSNYINSGILWRIFCQTGIFAGFSLHLINLAARISAAVMAGDIIQNFLYERAPGGPSLGPEGKHFVSGNSLFFSFWGSSEAAMGGGRAAPRLAWH